MGLARRISDRLALAGGVLLLGMAVLVTASVLRRWLTSQGVPGDFELLQTGLAVAVFAFMPLCQLRGGNLFVDTFTGRLPLAVRLRLDAMWALTYAGVATQVAVMMTVGAFETLRSGTRSMVLGLPQGWPIAVSAALAAWLAFVVLLAALDTFRMGEP